MHTKQARNQYTIETHKWEQNTRSILWWLCLVGGTKHVSFHTLLCAHTQRVGGIADDAVCGPFAC